MSGMAINYFYNPLVGFFKSLIRAMEISGMTRAANELQRLGYSKEANKIYDDIKKGRI